ncbi:STAS domain-containing protein [Mycolicibacterium komossense]|uniref:STAS domain-containing protein n=1 Tax=Mycolicibacterium komossense TaxID=1779 RepID=A0ABT3CFW8_9MYCO|nr:STAS domain-containing protein [Mycolicibacterium komossense]MCV7228381.1 STAS domain-containing protein [Mycolicibacterium komossense]
MTVQRRCTDTHLLLHVVGTVDVLTLPVLDRHIAKALWSDPPPILMIDLTCVDFLSSAGMQILLEAHDLTPAGTRLAIIATPRLARIFDALSITDIIEVYPTILDALTRG